MENWLENLQQNFLKMSPEEFNSVDEIMLPFNGRSYLRQYIPNEPHKWGFTIWRCSGVSGFLYDFDVYQSRSNKISSTFGVSGGVVAMLCSTLPKQENHKLFADNLFYQSTITH